MGWSSSGARVGMARSERALTPTAPRLPCPALVCMRPARAHTPASPHVWACTHQALAVRAQRRRHGPQARAELGRKVCSRPGSLLLLLRSRRRRRCRRRRRLRRRWLRLQPLDLFLQPLLLTGQERAALLRRLSAVARLSRGREECCAAQAVVAGRRVITGTGSSTHEGIAPPAQRPVPSPARAGRRLRSSSSQPLPPQKMTQQAPPQKTTQPAPAQRTNQPLPPQKMAQQAPAQKTIQPAPAQKTSQLLPLQKMTQ